MLSLNSEAKKNFETESDSLQLHFSSWWFKFNKPRQDRQLRDREVEDSRKYFVILVDSSHHHHFDFFQLLQGDIIKVSESRWQVTEE